MNFEKINFEEMNFKKMKSIILDSFDDYFRRDATVII